MVTGALLACFWVAVAAIGALGGIAFVLGMKGAGL